MNRSRTRVTPSSSTVVASGVIEPGAVPPIFTGLFAAIQFSKLVMPLALVRPMQ